MRRLKGECRVNDERRRLYFRSLRVYMRDGDWFVRTRERVELGPFRSRFEAEVEAELVVDMLEQLGGQRDARAALEAFVHRSRMDATA
jgi:hypothetical protein